MELLVRGAVIAIILVIFTSLPLNANAGINTVTVTHIHSELSQSTLVLPYFQGIFSLTHSYTRPPDVQPKKGEYEKTAEYRKRVDEWKSRAIEPFNKKSSMIALDIPDYKFRDYTYGSAYDPDTETLTLYILGETDVGSRPRPEGKLKPLFTEKYRKSGKKYYVSSAPLFCEENEGMRRVQGIARTEKYTGCFVIAGFHDFFSKYGTKKRKDIELTGFYQNRSGLQIDLSIPPQKAQDYRFHLAIALEIETSDDPSTRDDIIYTYDGASTLIVKESINLRYAIIKRAFVVDLRTNMPLVTFD